jgi:hypothetical protein
LDWVMYFSPIRNDTTMNSARTRGEPMKHRLFPDTIWSFSVALILIWSAATMPAFAQKRTTLYNFTNGADGAWPFAGVTLSNGSLYGTAFYGGDEGCSGDGVYCGTVFELTPPVNKGGTWTESTIYTFGQNPQDGSGPDSELVFDGKGNLYGTTSVPNSLYQLVPTAGGGWTSNWPDADTTPLPPVVDKANNLYESEDDAGENGAVFELTPNTDGTFTKTVLYAFGGGSDGQFPGGLVMDGAGRIWGTTNEGGDTSCQPPLGCGTIFVLLPPSPGGVWTHEILYDFAGGSQGSGGFYPLARDAKGNLYGITSGADSQSCSGIVCAIIFELSPPAQKGGAWIYTLLHTFQDGNDGAYPQGSLVLDSHGALYGTTTWGGNGPCVQEGALVGCGTVFRLTPPSKPGGAWTEAFLHRFQGGSDGSYPRGSVALDEKNVVLFGTTSFGGSLNSGTVFAITR